MGRSRQIEKFPNYRVTDNGNVYNKNGKRLKPHEMPNGYSNVSLNNDIIKRKSIGIHRLVAEAFIPNPDNLPQVNHKNEIKNDNRVRNLEWCSPLDNLKYSNVIDKASVAKYSPVLCITTGEYFKCIKDAAEKYDLHHSNIVACCNGRRPRCGGYEWRYLDKGEKYD